MNNHKEPNMIEHIWYIIHIMVIRIYVFLLSGKIVISSIKQNMIFDKKVSYERFNIIEIIFLYLKM